MGTTAWWKNRSVVVPGALVLVLAGGAVVALSGEFLDTRSIADASSGTEQAPEAPAAQSAEQGPLAEFLAIAERVEQSNDPWMGRGPMAALTAKLSSMGVPTGERINTRAKLAMEHLRLGNVDEALLQINTALAEFEAAGGKGGAELIRARALVNLRKAEVENCIERHNADCCIFPLQGGAIHVVREPALKAKEDLLQYLALMPPIAGDETRRQRILSARWLLNIVFMALNEYPQAVPAEVLLPPSAFASDTDIGRFIDVAPQLGLDSFDLAGGVIVDDFDNDGLLDIVTSTCALRGPMKAFRNVGDGTFEDVAAKWGLDQQLGGLNIVSVDYNNDGWLDIFVPRGAWMYEAGEMRNSLLRNDFGGGFTDVTRAAGLVDPIAPTQAVVWADFDNDGWLDVYIGNESTVETSKTSKDYPSTLFRNNRNGTFTDVTAPAGVANNRFTKGVSAGDYDNDGDMDLYVSNLGRNRLYRNDGDMKFTDVAAQARVEAPISRSFASWFFDYDNDGWLDLWVAGYGSGAASELAAQALGQPDSLVRPCMYRNNRDGTFTNVTAQLNLDKAFLPMGANFGDFDYDGWLDIYLGTGDPNYESLMPNVALRNDRGLRFQDITQSSGLGHLQKGHGIGFADIDHDGDQDIYHQLGAFFPGDAFRNALYVNPGHGNHFVAIALEGVETNRMAWGARIKLVVETPSGTREIHRAPGCVSSFGGSPRRQEIGLGDATAIRLLEISWPKSGKRQTFTNVPLDSFIRIMEGEAEFETLQPVKLNLGGDQSS